MIRPTGVEPLTHLGCGLVIRMYALHHSPTA